MLKMRGKRGQVAIFVIIALLIVVGIVVFFIVRPGVERVPAEFRPVYAVYDQCIEQETRAAIDLAGSQGGDIYLDDYVYGSEYAPFSSHLNFLGFPVPYWYYIAGNGLVEENVPKEKEIEEEMERYIGERVNECNFDELYTRGFYITLGEPEVKVNIEDDRIEVEVDASIVATKGEESARKTSHSAEVDSKFGKFYAMAREIYELEREGAFLENYSLDALRVYAPVDGVALECAPQIWKTREVVDELKFGLEGNIASIKLKGDYYTLSERIRQYFVVDKEVEESINFLYSSDWPTKVEITGEGVEEEVMIAKPVGSQGGLGAMGFCYVPYHFVYDVNFPVMIQIYDERELFQFPVAVIIDNNLPVESEFFDMGGIEEVEELCDFMTEDIEVNVYDTNLNPVEGDVSYVCFDTQCDLGKSKNGQLVVKAPSCVNGYLKVRADGFIEKKQLFSSNSERVADVILDREYDVKISLLLDGKESGGNAIVTFIGDRSASAVLPGMDEVKLSEGTYEIRVYVYGDSQIKLPASTKTECVDVPRTGLLGIVGMTKEECFDITIPETTIESALIGGGSSESYMLGSELEKGEMVLRASSLPTPKSLEEMQNNYAAFESLIVYEEFR
jgi:hypothetical protein